MDREQKYNGWNNFETWLVALWLDNDCSTYRAWREEALECWKTAAQSDRVLKWNWSRHEGATFQLAELLENAVREGSSIEESGLYADLLNAALSDVDWREIASHYLADVTSEEAFKVGGGNTP